MNYHKIKLFKIFFKTVIEVTDSRSVKKSYQTKDLKNGLGAWYQIRSNLQHRGKESLYDAELIMKSSIGLSNLLMYILRLEIPDIDNEWFDFLGIPLSDIEWKATY